MSCLPLTRKEDQCNQGFWSFGLETLSQCMYLDLGLCILCYHRWETIQKNQKELRMQFSWFNACQHAGGPGSVPTPPP